MTTEKIDAKSVLDQIDEEVAVLIEEMSLIDEHKINDIPYQDGWTAGQLFDHITKSTITINQNINQDGTPAKRDPGARIEELKNTFLDFSTQLKSPAFILPEQKQYDKLDAIKNLGSSFQELKVSASNHDLAVVVKSILGELTKWELLHFVLFHTQRHLQQMKKIHEALRNKA
jgi:DinB superfamily